MLSSRSCAAVITMFFFCMTPFVPNDTIGFQQLDFEKKSLNPELIVEKK